MDGSSGIDSAGAGTLNSVSGKCKVDDMPNAEDSEALADVSEDVEEFTSFKRQKYGHGLTR